MKRVVLSLIIVFCSFSLFAQTVEISGTVFENGKYKKIYSITDSGKQNLIEWVSTPMEIQSSKNPELAKLYFMGFSTKEKREAGLQEYISKLKEQYDVLNAICKEAENVKVPDEDKDILHYQLTAARYGKDFM